MSDARLAPSEAPATTAEGDQNRATLQVLRIVLGLAADPAAAFAVVVLSLAPPWLSAPLCAGLYAVVLLAERRCGIVSPQTIALFFVCAAGAMIEPALADARALAQSEEIAIFAVLAALSLILFATRRSRARYYGGTWGPQALHNAIAGVWLVIGLSALGVLLAEPSSLFARWSPPLLATIGGVLALAMNTVWFGSANRRQRTFSLGDFTFRQVSDDAAAVDGFSEFFAGEIWEAVTRDRRTRVRHTRDEILEDLRRSEAGTRRSRPLYFYALHEDKVVGTIAIALDGAGRRLPVETAFGVTFDPLRRFGRVMEVRRLCVNKNHRFNEDVIRGLLKCAIEVALENDVSFLVDFAFGFAVGLLMKVGFDVVQPHDREICEFGAPMRLLAFNFARRQFSLAALDGTQESMREIVSLYLRYRYVQRAALRQWWLPEPRRASSLSIDRIRSLCLPEGPA